MKKHPLLLPHRCKPAGWIVLGLGLALLIVAAIVSDFDFTLNQLRGCFGLAPLTEPEGSISFGFSAGSTGLMNTLTWVLILVGCFLTGFSRCREEDEFTEHLRYRALTVTMYILMGLMLILVLFWYGLNFALLLEFVVKMAPLFYVVYFHVILLIERGKHEE